MSKPVFKQRAYSILKNKIVNCEYKPGTWLNETVLVQELGFSRTPIREALTLIEQEGFVRIRPKKGIFVTEITFNDVRQIFQTRKQIEPIALKMAGSRLPQEELMKFRDRFLGEMPEIPFAFRLDTAMHLFIIEHCGNRFIVEMMRKVFEENTRIIISSKQNEVEIHDARAEHAEILNLLIAGEIERAAAVMQEHIRHCERAAMEFFYYSSTADETQFMYKDSLDRSSMA
jgi:DNA-binding GntR family transcriptional regulator